MTRARRIRWLALVALALLLTACGAGGIARIGISRGGPNGVRIHFIACPGERVTKIALLGRAESQGFSIGSDEPGGPEDDEFAAWQIRASGDSDLSAFDVGNTPPGFVEEVPLTEPVPEVDGGHAAFIGFDRGGLRSAQMAFDLDELVPDSITTSNGVVSPAEYERSARADCEE